MSALPTGEPRVNHDTKPYWEATAAGRIDLPVCNDCGTVVFYPRSICPDCLSESVTWRTMSGRGTIYSYTITRAGVSSKWREHLPLIVAYVELEEGPRMLTNIVDTDPESVHVDMPVVAVFDPTEVESDDGGKLAIVRFTAA
ncbi:MAG: Zn-ribbon domain-containing OB-fold protein [Actinomycetota bacterium]